MGSWLAEYAEHFWARHQVRRSEDAPARMVFLLLVVATPSHALFVAQTLLFHAFSSGEPWRWVSDSVWIESVFMALGVLYGVIWLQSPNRTSPWIVRAMAAAVAARWTISWFFLAPADLWITIASTMLLMPPLLLLANLSNFRFAETATYLFGMCGVTIAGVQLSAETEPFYDGRLPAALIGGWGLLAGYFQIWNKQREELSSSLVLQRRLLDQALRDELTGLPNRRAGSQFLLESMWQSVGVGVALIDIDHFKRINDRHGHDVGDEVLTAVGQCLQEVAGTDEWVFRWGGEEFLAILPDHDREATLAWAESLRRAVASLRPLDLEVTVSAGVATTSDPEDEDLLRRADQALYEAKGAGRNRVCG